MGKGSIALRPEEESSVELVCLNWRSDIFLWSLGKS